MRKIMAITTLCFFSLLFSNEKAICKSNCQVSPKKSNCQESGKKTNNRESGKKVKPSFKKIEVDTDPDKALKQYDGFFFKI